MPDKASAAIAPRNSLLTKFGPLPVPEAKAPAQDEGEESCAAFGFLRGIRDRALALEFRLRDGNHVWLSYNLLSGFQFNPSVGLLLRFSGDIVTMVLIRGSNLDAPVQGGTMTLPDKGLQRHRIVWVREMDDEESRRVGEREPTVDKIEIRAFDTEDEAQVWLLKFAPTFARKP